MEENLTRHQVWHVRSIFTDEMKLCGCGNPEEAHRLVLDILNAAPFYEDAEKVVRIVGNEGSHYLVLTLLDSVGLITHGGGLGGSWLTPKGVWLRDALRGVTDWEALDNAIDNHEMAQEFLPHTCTPACWDQ
jgi:hypothetical protein